MAHNLNTIGAPEYELTNQDSGGGKSCTVLSGLTAMYVNRKSIEVW